LSPYFLVKSDDPGVDQLPLKSTSATVNISGVIADVVVTQVYKNEGTRALEAIYVFPASTRAAVYGMKMTIGERTITAQIAKREEARHRYEAAKQAGISASLLEQQRPNVFQMNVANILPGDMIRVELRYTELLVPTDRVYEFVYPTVVGPRYSNQGADEASPKDQWIANPYLHQGEGPSYAFDMAVHLSAGLPIRDVTSPSHKILVKYDGPGLSSIGLDPAERAGGNRDFILKYRLAADRIQQGLLLFEGEQENFFLLMLQPPKRVAAEWIPPREYIFIVDVSGSMHGFPLDISKKLLRDLIGSLRPSDRFNVLLFAGGSSLMAERSLPATPENIRQALGMIDRERGGGGTELLPALQRALALPESDGYSRSVVIATDGYVNVEEQAFDLVRSNLGRANMFAFGIGSSVNRHLIEGMARVGMGEPFVVTRPEEASDQANKFRELIQSPVLTDIKVDFGGFEVYDVEPPAIPDVLADRPVILFGKWRGRAKGVIKVSGTSGKGPFLETIDVGHVQPSEAGSALRYLWARHRIALLSDYNSLSPRDERTKEVTTLGLTYNLLTAYTSFIAVDTQVRLKDGQAVLVKQPLPLPQGVSDLAVGNGRGAMKSMAMAAAPSVHGGWVADSSLKLREEREAFGLPREDKDSRPMTIELGKIEVKGTLAIDVAARIIEKEMTALRMCHRNNATDRPLQKGEKVFTLLVSPDGRVTRVVPQKGDKGDRAFEDCVIQKLKTLLFSATGDGKGVEITITLVFA
ncbi:MAG: VWA domain-containing protein, partial [Desulfobacterales bacterium]|nr:VWA domain-containing protein [Desulfobacterales bacterium]